MNVTTRIPASAAHWVQRSFDCMADDTTAAPAHYATSAELAFPRFAAAQIWATMDGVSTNWAGRSCPR